MVSGCNFHCVQITATCISMLPEKFAKSLVWGMDFTKVLKSMGKLLSDWAKNTLK